MSTTTPVSSELPRLASPQVISKAQIMRLGHACSGGNITLSVKSSRGTDTRTGAITMSPPLLGLRQRITAVEETGLQVQLSGEQAPEECWEMPEQATVIAAKADDTETAITMTYPNGEGEYTLTLSSMLVPPEDVSGGDFYTLQLAETTHHFRGLVQFIVLSDMPPIQGWADSIG